LLRAVRAAVRIPLTLKFRAGWDEENLNYVDTARIAEDAGVAALALHPRTREQAYRGSADWSRVAEVKRHVGIPVIGSGDVNDAWDALHRLHQSAVDGVMIGRGAMANPWIFLQISQIRAGEAPFTPELLDKYELLLRYYAMCRDVMPERIALNKLKQLIGQFSLGGLPGSAGLRAAVQRSTGPAEALAQLEAFFLPRIEAATLSV
jgi:tRNA-dihydrouridine synthase